jgi:hypothetical protein
LRRLPGEHPLRKAAALALAAGALAAPAAHAAKPSLATCERTARAVAVPPGDGARFRIARPRGARARDGDEIGLAVADRIDAFADHADTASALAAANRAQQALYALLTVQAEVDDGGFDQFFWNSSGELVHEAILGAELLAARPYEELLCRAVSLFPGGRVPKERGARQRALERIGDRGGAVLSQLDGRWYDVEDAPRTQLARYFLRYAKAHPRELFR